MSDLLIRLKNSLRQKRVNNILKRTVTILERHNIPYWVDSGTLLSIVRDGKLPAEHNNINLAIPEKNLNQFLSLKRHFKPWYKLRPVYDSHGKEWIEGNISRVRIQLFFLKARQKSVEICITPKHFRDGYARWIDGNALKQVAVAYFATLEKKVVHGVAFAVPYHAEEYLSRRYGNWRTVNTQWNTVTDDISIIPAEVANALTTKTKFTHPPYYKKLLCLEGTTLQRAIKMLRFVTHMLDKHGIPYWLDDGTLLGIIRDGRLIPWDKDIDLGVPGEFSHTVLALRWKFFPLYRITRHYTTADTWLPGRQRSTKIRSLRTTLARDTLHIDIFFKYKLDNEYRWIDSHCRKKVPPRYYDSLRSITWEGGRYWIPSHVEEYLAERYGPDWKIPRKNFDTSIDEPCIVK